MAERDLAADDPAAVAHARAADDPAGVGLVAGVPVAGDLAADDLGAAGVDPRRNRRTMAKSKVSRFRA